MPFTKGIAAIEINDELVVHANENANIRAFLLLEHTLASAALFPKIPRTLEVW